MFTKKPEEDPGLERFETLAAVWILASNDESPEVSYRDRKSVV